MYNADNFIEGVFINGITGITFLEKNIHCFCDRQVGAKTTNLNTWHHYLPDDSVIKVKNILNELTFIRLNCSTLLAFCDNKF